ncbi:hypothetical protein [Clostridium vincentii]|uniref:Uncharacterized protein n=1 Tax=Clostridium vincentii TaxID=52704 RepID=A0A2T0BC48_9CLOT|nr:hypothetical protein [Clostridium vincentii]PRR81415.1 hypothetical protein CLVI_25380 [Clostridium vincentii]
MKFILIFSIIEKNQQDYEKLQNEIEKLEFTLVNVQVFFKDQYYVENVNVDDRGTNETFVTKTNVTEEEAPKLLKDIQAKIKENFVLKVPNSITLLNNDYKILGSNNNYPEDGEDN